MPRVSPPVPQNDASAAIAFRLELCQNRDMYWTGFLPKNAVVMAKKKAEIKADTESNLLPPPEVLPQVLEETPVVAPKAVVSVLIFLEAEPNPTQRELLTKMMGAIGLTEADFLAEWGEFPTSASSFVLGLGLGPKKSARLSALRPDWLSLPSLAEIQLEPSQKRAAWSSLQQFQARLRMPR
jgi:hypothetical protein